VGSWIAPNIIMKQNLLTGLLALLAGPLLAAETNLSADVRNAAAALGAQTNYSWHALTETAGGGGRFGGPTDGRTERGGYTLLSLTRGDTTIEAVFKGTNGAIKSPGKGWQSTAEAAQDNGAGPGPAMFLARTVQNFKAPAVLAADLAGQAKDLKKDTNGISGDLTEDGAKALLTFRPRGGGGDSGGPTVSNAKGSVKFWLANGRLAKYQFHVQGHISFDGNDRDVDRTTTVEIKDVNSTKIEVPEDAKKKLP
jgi:hypothetical protein